MNQPQLLQVLIVEDHPVVADALRLVLESTSDLAWLGRVTTPDAALEFCRTRQPDVIMMNIPLDGYDAIISAQDIRQQYPFVQIILLLDLDDPALIIAAQQAGFSASLAKDRSAEEIIAALRRVIRGG